MFGSQDALTGVLIGLARATEGNDHMLSDSTAAAVIEGLLATANADLEREVLKMLLERLDGEKRKLVPACYECAANCGRTSNYDMAHLQSANDEVRSLKLSLLSGICDIAARISPDCKDKSIHMFLYKALYAIGRDDWGKEELLPILQEVAEVKKHI